MGYNKRVLSKAVSELGKAKAPAKPKDIITDPAGQWKYPGQKTRIPGNDITMQGVNYPVWGQPNVGKGSMMQPGQNYLFPGADYVDETPMAKKGGTLNSKKYSKSISATNKLFAKNKLFQNKKSKIFDPNSKFKSGGSKLGPINLDPNPLSHYELNYGYNLPTEQDGGVRGNPWLYTYNQESEDREPGQVIGLGADFQHKSGLHGSTNVELPFFNKNAIGNLYSELGYNKRFKNFDADATLKNYTEPGSKFNPSFTTGIGYNKNLGDHVGFGVGVNNTMVPGNLWNPAGNVSLKYNFQDGGENADEYMDLTDEEIQAYRDAGYEVDELPEAQEGEEVNSNTYTYAGRPGSTYQKDANNNWLIKNNNTKGEYVPVQDPTGERTKTLNAQAKSTNTYNPKFNQPSESTNVNNPYKKSMPAYDPNKTMQYMVENKIKSENKNVEDYYKNYHKSPRYMEMLKKSSPENWEKFNENRNINLYGEKNFNILGEDYSKPKIKIKHIQPKDAPDEGGYSQQSGITVLPTGFNVKGILPHEWSHSIDRPLTRNLVELYTNGKGRQIPKKDIEYIMKNRAKGYLTSPQFLNSPLINQELYLKNKNKPQWKSFIKNNDTFNNYVGDPTETRARLNDMRYQAKQKGIYDPFTEKVTPETYEKLLKTKFETGEEEGFDALMQLKRVYTDEQIQWMLNNISQNQNQEDDVQQGFGKTGGYVQHELVKAQTGLTKKPLLISDPKEFAFRNKMYNDSLSLYNASQKTIGSRFPKITKEKFNEIEKKNSELPAYIFDKKQQLEDKKNKKEKPLNEYVVKTTHKNMRSEPVFIKNKKPQPAWNDPNKFAIPLKDGTIKIPGYVIGDKPEFSIYTIYDPSTGSRYDYLENFYSNKKKPTLLGVSSDTIKPVSTNYYGEDFPTEYDSFNITEESQVNGKTTSNLNNEYKNFFYQLGAEDVYAKPVQPVQFLKTNDSQNENSILPIQEEKVDTLPLKPIERFTSPEQTIIPGKPYVKPFKPRYGTLAGDENLGLSRNATQFDIEAARRKFASDEFTRKTLEYQNKQRGTKAPITQAFQKGGTRKPLEISDPKEFAYRNKMYADSLTLYNQSLDDRKWLNSHTPLRISPSGKPLYRGSEWEKYRDKDHEKFYNAKKRLEKANKKAPKGKDTDFDITGTDRSRPEETWGTWFTNYKKPVQPVTVKKAEVIQQEKNTVDSLPLLPIKNIQTLNPEFIPQRTIQPKSYSNPNRHGVWSDKQLPRILSPENWLNKTREYQEQQRGLKQPVSQIRKEGGALVKAQTGLETEPQIAEEDKYAPTVMDEVVVKGEKADWAKLQEQYEKNTPYEDYFHKRKEKYLKSRPKNLTKLMGIGNDDVPESVANSIYNDYQYRKNNYVTKNLGPKKGFNPRKHGEWVDNLSNKEREIISNSRYGKNLQPSLWARTGAGAQELANFLVKSTGIPALMGDPDKDVLNYKTSGLTNKEWNEIHNSGTGGLETFSGVDVFGAAVANKLKNSKREQPGLFSGQLMGNVSPGDAAGLNPFLYTGIGEMMAGKSLLGLGADALRPGAAMTEIPGGSSNVDFSKYLTQEEAVAARGERLISQKNKPGWDEQLTPEIEERLSTAVERHNPASNYPGERIGANTMGRTATEISKDANLKGVPLTDANKARVAAHEVGHYYSNSPAEGKEWVSHFDFSKLPQKTRDYLMGKGWKARNTDYANEVRERAAQLKDYIAQKNGIPLNQDFTITESMLDDAITNYIKDTGLDNTMSKMLGALTDKKGLLKTMNKYALGTIPAVIGAGALQQEKNGGSTESWEDELDDNQIERLRRAGYTVDELDEVEDVDTYQTGGPTVSQLWKEHTGTDWSEAHRQGLTSGSYADNMKLRDRILNSEFDNITPGNNIQQNRVKSQNHRDAYVKNVQNLINNNKSLDDLVSMRMGTREGLLNLFPNLGSAKAPVNKPVANTVLPVNNKPVSKPAVKVDRRMAATSSPNSKLPQLKVFDKQVKTVKPKVKEIRSVNINKSATSSPESFNLDKYRTLTDIQQRFADAKKYNVANKIKQKEKVLKKEDKSVQWQMPQLGINAPTPKAKYPTNINNAASNFNTKNKNQKVLPGKKLKEVDRGIMATYIDPIVKEVSAPINSALNTLYDVGESIGEKTESTLGKVGELYESYKKEGLINALTQAKNSQKDPEVYKTVIKPKAKIVKPIPQAKEEAYDNDRLAENYQNITDAGNYTINTFSKKLSGVPLGVRNREDERDIKGKAIAYTYAPFKTYNEHLGNSYGGISLKPNSVETDNQPVIVYDNDKMYIDTFKNQKNTGKLISPTYKTDSVTDLVIDKSNRYSSNIEQKMIKLKTARGDKDIPVGTADSSEGSFKDWSGGHLMLENPKTKEVVVIHGKSYELQKMFRKFLQENKLKSANIIETDHKAYSLIKNPKNNILTGEFNRARDNANTKSSGSGNFIYSKI